MQCSMQPLIPDKKAFWREGSTSLFDNRNDWKREARIRWKVLPTAEERAIIRKFEGSEVEPDLWIRVTLDCAQQGGALPL